MGEHKVTIEGRESIAVTAVKEIDSFDEGEVRLSLTDGAMIIKGARLHVRLLDLEEGRASVSGRVDSILYVKSREKSAKGFFARLMK